MKRIEINTIQNENYQANNNGFSFPEFSGLTNPNYYLSQTSDSTVSIQSHRESSLNKYTICLDWVEFICTWENPIERTYLENRNKSIRVEKISVHKNPNFRNLHRIYYDGVEVCDIYSGTNNGAHKYNEVSIKIANHQLYSSNYPETIRKLLSAFRLTFTRFARWDIALDGQDIRIINETLNKFVRSHTVQIKNDSIKIAATAFNKKELRWESWVIGSQKSGMSARVYDKSKEIIQSGKQYVNQFWVQNNLATEMVGRFEVQLNYKRLKKYTLGIDCFDKLTNAEFIGAVFTGEVRSWFKFYRVLKRNMMEHKKEYAIAKGNEIRTIKWNHIPRKMELLQFCDHQSHASRINAQRSISFTLKEILRYPNTSTTAQVETIEKYACDYHLQGFMSHKIRDLFGNDIKSPYIEILKPLVNNGFNREKRE